MKIVSINITSTKIPTFRPHKMNIGTTFYQENVIIRIVTDTEIIGYGEAPHMLGHSAIGETPTTVRAVLRDKIVPAILGQDPSQIENIWKLMERMVPGNNRAKSSIILACYDIVGKTLNTPVYNILGGKLRDRIPLSWSLAINDFDSIVQEALLMVERGWQILKLKIGRKDPMDDVEAVKRVRQAVGPEIRLRADANQAYDVKTAVRVIAEMAKWNLEFIEQPCPAWDLDGMASVRKISPIPIMADESIKSVHPIKALAEVIRRRAADYVSIYVCDPGGILNAKKMIILAEAFDMRGYIGGALESIIGTAAGLHLAASSPSISLGCEMSGQYLLTDGISAKKISMKDGCLLVPDDPGLGVEVDEDKIKQYEVGTAETFNI